MASTDARPVPVKNTALRITFPILDADGDPVTSAAGLDSEVSKDGGAFADCTNEATEIGNGIYYLDLTNTEMNADTVAIAVKTSTTGAKTTLIVLYPQETGDIQVNVTYWNGSAVTAPNTAGTPVVDVTRINNSTQAAIRQQLLMGQVAIPGTVDNTGFTPTATQFEASDITEATASHFLKRTLYPTSGSLVGMGSVITGYTLTGGRGHFTIAGFPTGETIANGNTFLII